MRKHDNTVPSYQLCRWQLPVLLEGVWHHLLLVIKGGIYGHEMLSLQVEYVSNGY